MLKLTFLLALVDFDPNTFDPKVFGQFILDAITSKNYPLVGGLVVWAVVWALRTYGSRIPYVGKYLASGIAGPVLAVLTAALGSMIGGLLSGGSFNWHALFGFLATAASAVFTQEVQQKVRELSAGKAVEAVPNLDAADKVLKGGS